MQCTCSVSDPDSITGTTQRSLQKKDYLMQSYDKKGRIPPYKPVFGIVLPVCKFFHKNGAGVLQKSKIDVFLHPK